MEGFFKLIRAKWRTVVVLLLPIILVPLITSGAKEARAGYVIIVMAVFWMTEALPLPITSFLPIILFPLLGIMSTNDACIAYMKETNVTFIGGLIIALSIEYSNLHKRIALRVLLLVGTQPRWLMFGFMVTTMFLSMWISNTAATAMMVPIAEAVVHELTRQDGEKQTEDLAISNLSVSTTVSLASLDSSSVSKDGTTIRKMDSLQNEEDDGVKNEKQINNEVENQIFVTNEKLEEKNKKLSTGIMLSIAYASNIGGTGSLIGSGPQLTLKGIVNGLFGSSTGLNFVSWMAFNVPGMLINSFVAWIWLQFQFIGFKKADSVQNKRKGNTVKHVLQQKYNELGPMTFHELATLSIFMLCVTLWCLRDPQFIPGWAELVSSTHHVDDATSVLATAMLLFIIPAHPQLPSFLSFGSREQDSTKEQTSTLLTWKYVEKKLPWGMVLLLGGGFALSDGAKVSGLSNWLGYHMAELVFLPPFAIMLIVCIATALLTEVASNTATANILLPILAQMAVNIGVNPLFLMIPATVACSFAFMLPVATPSNALVFAANKMNTVDMIKAGFVMNVVCVVVICCMVASLGNTIFKFDTFPLWATHLMNNQGLNQTHVKH